MAAKKKAAKYLNFIGYFSLSVQALGLGTISAAAPILACVTAARASGLWAWGSWSCFCIRMGVGMGAIFSILLLAILVGCSSDETISTEVPVGYASASKVESQSWEEKALGALTIAEANAAEPAPVQGPMPVSAKEKPGFVVRLKQPVHISKKLAKKSSRPHKRAVALARRK